MKLGQNVCFYDNLDELENGSCLVRKSMSLDQMLEKPCGHFKGHVFSAVIIKLAQNVCLDEVSGNFKNGFCRI